MRTIKYSLRLILKVLIGFIVFILSYLLSVWIISKIPVKAENTQSPKSIEIAILSNGVHTDIVMPIVTPDFDWSAVFSFQNTKNKYTDYQYIAIGWGDKGFYLETPSWAELRPSVAFKCAFGLSESALHTTFLRELKSGPNCVKMKISHAQYSKLIAFILSEVDYKQGVPQFIPTHMVYSDADAFYNAKGTYSMFYTCNSWANSALKAAGQKACLWTAFHGPIFEQYQ